jgi:predicted nucleic acid-binding protein
VVARLAGFLLDTNVVSELMKPRPNARVIKWLSATSAELLYLSALTIGEVRRGIDLLDESDPKR